MEPDKYQQAWQAEASQTRVSVDADLLRKQVQRNRQDFRATVFWRDLREIGVALLMIPVWFYLGAKAASPWTWYLMVPVLLWIAGFMLAYRLTRPRKPDDPDATLRESAESSLTDVEDQIWLLRNIFWWYLLPPGISLTVYSAHVSWLTSGSWWGALVATTLLCGIVFGVYYFVYLLNQRAVRLEFEPRRRELRQLLASLGDESTGEVSGEYPLQLSADRERCSPRRKRIAGLCALALLVIGVPATLYLASLIDRATAPGPDSGPATERSPFATVRWQQSVPEVKVNGEWFRLVALDELPAAKIVEFSQQTYGDRWQKRFEEDLVALLTRMGHPPGDAVKLVVQSLNSDDTQVLEDVPMTRENRQAIRAAALAEQTQTAHAQESAMNDSARSDQTSGKRRRWMLVAASMLGALALLAWASGFLRSGYAGEVKSDGPAGDTLAAQISSLRKEKNLVGLAAMATVDGQLVAVAADGERKQGSGVPLELEDRWHVGSITKSITATMIARLVESGQLQWTDTVGACFPEAAIHEDWKPVTLRQLLTHTAGAPANFSLEVRLKQPALGEECTRARREAVLEVVGAKPAHPPGETHAYSNVGYTIAGAMAEQVTGVSWAELVKREVFEPLQLAGAGFGPPASSDETLEQPRGHRPVLLGWKVAVDDKADNTPIIGPAGTVHMTLADLCAYATDHLRGELGEGRLLSAETYKTLHTPELEDYACGWVLKEPTDAIPHKLYWHNGSNTMWYALVVIIPDKNMTVAVTANDGSISKAESAAWKIVEAVAGHFDAEGDAALRKELPSEAFSKRSPFSAVRWQKFQPEVRVGEDWYQFISIDGVAAGDIVTFCRQNYGDKWQHRFEEDLVEVLVRMGHTPQQTVELVVCAVGSSETRTLNDVPISEANRRAIQTDNDDG